MIVEPEDVLDIQGGLNGLFKPANILVRRSIDVLEVDRQRVNPAARGQAVAESLRIPAIIWYGDEAAESSVEGRRTRLAKGKTRKLNSSRRHASMQTHFVVGNATAEFVVQRPVARGRQALDRIF